MLSFTNSHQSLLKNIYLFMYFWLCWIFVAARRLSLVAASRGYSLAVVQALPVDSPKQLGFDQESSERKAACSSHLQPTSWPPVPHYLGHFK